jgi:hypothetical protein
MQDEGQYRLIHVDELGPWVRTFVVITFLVVQKIRLVIHGCTRRRLTEMELFERVCNIAHDVVWLTSMNSNVQLNVAFIFTCANADIFSRMIGHDDLLFMIAKRETI